VTPDDGIGVTGERLIREIADIAKCSLHGRDARQRFEDDLAPYAGHINRLVDAAYSAGYVAGIQFARDALDQEIAMRDALSRP
jgi:hypothetical protein